MIVNAPLLCRRSRRCATRTRCVPRPRSRTVERRRARRRVRRRDARAAGVDRTSRRPDAGDSDFRCRDLGRPAALPARAGCAPGVSLLAQAPAPARRVFPASADRLHGACRTATASVAQRRAERRRRAAPGAGSRAALRHGMPRDGVAARSRREAAARSGHRLVDMAPVTRIDHRFQRRTPSANPIATPTKRARAPAAHSAERDRSSARDRTRAACIVDAVAAGGLTKWLVVRAAAAAHRARRRFDRRRPVRFGGPQVADRPLIGTGRRRLDSADGRLDVAASAPRPPGCPRGCRRTRARAVSPSAAGSTFMVAQAASTADVRLDVERQPAVRPALQPRDPSARAGARCQAADTARPAAKRLRQRLERSSSAVVEAILRIVRRARARTARAARRGPRPASRRRRSPACAPIL